MAGGKGGQVYGGPLGWARSISPQLISSFFEELEPRDFKRSTASSPSASCLPPSSLHAGRPHQLPRAVQGMSRGRWRRGEAGAAGERQRGRVRAKDTKTRGGWEDRRSGTRTRGGTSQVWRPGRSPTPQGQPTAGSGLCCPLAEGCSKEMVRTRCRSSGLRDGERSREMQRETRDTERNTETHRETQGQRKTQR